MHAGPATRLRAIDLVSRSALTLPADPVIQASEPIGSEEAACAKLRLTDADRTLVIPSGGGLLRFDVTDGTISIVGADTNLREFDLRNTADGANVVSAPVDAITGGAPVTLTFDSVTGAGETTLATSTTGPTVPTGFQLGGAGVYYEIHTTATFSGTVELCIDYTGTTFADESTLQLMHYEKNKWVNVTTERDPATNTICGVVKSFSPFVVVEFPAMSALNDLVVRVQNLDVRHGIIASLDAKLDAAVAALDHALSGNRASAVNCLNAFIAEVRAQNSKKLPADVAAGLIADAETIIGLLGG